MSAKPAIIGIFRYARTGHAFRKGDCQRGLPKGTDLFEQMLK